MQIYTRQLMTVWLHPACGTWGRCCSEGQAAKDSRSTCGEHLCLWLRCCPISPHMLSELGYAHTSKANVHVEYMHVLSGQVSGELFKANETHFLTPRIQCCSGQKNAANCVSIIWCCASASSSHNPPTFCSTLRHITLKWQHQRYFILLWHSTWWYYILLML